MSEKIAGLSQQTAEMGVPSTYLPVQASRPMLRSRTMLTDLEEWMELWTDHKQELGTAVITAMLGIWMLDKFAIGALVFLASAGYWGAHAIYHNKFLNQFSDFRVVVRGT